jgi:hypothetical protein
VVTDRGTPIINESESESESTRDPPLALESKHAKLAKFFLFLLANKLQINKPQTCIGQLVFAYIVVLKIKLRERERVYGMCVLGSEI